MHFRLAFWVVLAGALASIGGCGDDREPGGAPGPVPGETGQMVGMTAAHNRFRAMADTTTALPALTWDTALAAASQAWSEHLASTGCNLEHSGGDYGENLYWQIGSEITADAVVASWYDEISCYDYGTFMGSDMCDPTCIAAMRSSGCGHYTQIVWRDTRKVGCGVATCASGAEIWTCRYDPAGNYLGENPY